MKPDCLAAECFRFGIAAHFYLPEPLQAAAGVKQSGSGADPAAGEDPCGTCHDGCVAEPTGSCHDDCDTTACATGATGTGTDEVRCFRHSIMLLTMVFAFAAYPPTPSQTGGGDAASDIEAAAAAAVAAADAASDSAAAASDAAQSAGQSAGESATPLTQDARARDF